jgi:hypothetical protein
MELKGNLIWILAVASLLLIGIVLFFFWDTLKKLWSDQGTGRGAEPERKHIPSIAPRDAWSSPRERPVEAPPASEPAWESSQPARAAQPAPAAPAFPSGETTMQILVSLQAIEKGLENLRQLLEAQRAAGVSHAALLHAPSGGLAGPMVEIRVNVSRPEDVAVSRAPGTAIESQTFRDLGPELIEQFNASPHPETALERYHPKRLGVVNQSEIRSKPWATPQFGFADDGACLFFKIDEDRGYVVPRPRRLYSADSHKFDGLKDLFDSNFQEQYEYWRTNLIKPAVVQRTGNYWAVEAKGQLELAFK